MDHARRIITKNRMRASIFVIRLWFQNGQSRPPAEYEKAKCGVVCYGELNIIMHPLKGCKSLTHVCYCLCAIVLVHICPNHFSVALLLRRRLLIYE